MEWFSAFLVVRHKIIILWCGLEIHDGNTGNNESFFLNYLETIVIIQLLMLKHRVFSLVMNDFNSSSLEIKTSRFFLGGQSQFISGSNGNIEISSSNFHLQNDGDVVMKKVQSQWNDWWIYYRWI